MTNTETRDTIPLEDTVQTMGPDECGMMTQLFYAFNTVITLQAFGTEAACLAAFQAARADCRTFERQFSRTLPHSDISKLNTAKGAPVPLEENTATLLKAALQYCADSEGCFDITVGSVVRLWNFHQGIIPDQTALDAALTHVDWNTLTLWEEPNGQTYAQLADPQAAIDVGGIAKGWIADRLTQTIAGFGIEAFIINLGGNVVAHGEKPGGNLWRIGLQDPRNKGDIVGAVPLLNASAVTSGVYERCFQKDHILYHHILNPRTGYPAKTDAAGATVIAERSLDAEGYSTTLLALGIERGIAFAKKHPAILHAYFVDYDGIVHEA